MTVTSNTIANQAIQLMGDNQSPVTGEWPNFDNSTAGTALNYLYGPCVAKVQRFFEWDASRNTVALTLTPNAAPFPWAYQYYYPSNGIQIWQLIPDASADRNNPLPINWSVANAVVNGTQRKVINTNVANAEAIYNNNPTEDTWDADFRDAVVRMLASDLAIAVASKPETSQGMMQAGGAMVEIAKSRDS